MVSYQWTRCIPDLLSSRIKVSIVSTLFPSTSSMKSPIRRNIEIHCGQGNNIREKQE